VPLRLTGLKRTVLALHSLVIGYEHGINARWLANMDRAHSHFSHKFRSSYEFPIPYQSNFLLLNIFFLVKRSCRCLHPLPILCWPLSLEPSTHFEHVVQSMLNKTLFGAKFDNLQKVNVLDNRCHHVLQWWRKFPNYFDLIGVMVHWHNN
jgi:hypothetical protein